MAKSHIIEEMLKKAEEAEKAGDSVKAEYWLKRAEEVEKIIERYSDHEI